MLLLSCVGLFVAWCLSLAHALGRSLPCGDRSACDAVATSAAARPLNVPVAYAGLLAYAVLAGLAVSQMARPSRPLQIASSAISFIGAIGNSLLTLYSATVIGATCEWCVASNAIFWAIAILCLVAEGRPLDSHCDWRRDRYLAAAALTGLGVALAVAPRLMVSRSRLSGYDVSELSKASQADLVPPDALSYSPRGYRRTLVAFVDVRCGACAETFPDLYDRCVERRWRLVVRHCPLTSHPGAFRDAVKVEKLSGLGKGIPYLLCRFRHYSRDFADTELNEYSRALEGAPGGRAARGRVLRDVRFCKRIHLASTPFIVEIDNGGKPTVRDGGETTDHGL